MTPVERIPATEAMLSTAPPDSAMPARYASCTNPRAATTFVSKILRTASRSASTSGPYVGLIPVLLTSMSIPPPSRTAFATASAR
ncbi:Uncharacterised protein [Mycobacteroides abscessus subsp. abscessus]|nr:Uncharacterised protein [Mycobacteroides abscessus subsp. abscessus]